MLSTCLCDYSGATTVWNKYQEKASAEGLNKYLNFSFDPSFQGVNRLFVSSIENEGDRKVQKAYHLPEVEIKDYTVMVDVKNF